MKTSKTTAGFKIPIQLPDREENRRDWFEKSVHDAQERIAQFAINHGWVSCVAVPLIKKFQVCGSKDQFDHEVKMAFKLDAEMVLPKTYSAVIADDVLLAVIPEVYAENYPDGQEEKAYEKLLAHELAHALHIRILEGNEDEMGPKWFYEGFALYAAGQFQLSSQEVSKQDMQNIIENDESVTYVYYRLIFNELLGRMSLKEAVDAARAPGFKFTI